MGFQWENKFYQETCLSFGLSTSPYVFNLFGEGFHWILSTYLDWQELEHYLDDFILIIPAISATTVKLDQYNSGYKLLTGCLGIPPQDAKDCMGTIVSVFGIEIDTNLFVARVPADKQQKAKDATGDALSKESLTLHEAQSLTGFLSFCAQVVRLGWVFMRKLWDFVASYPNGSSRFSKRRIPFELRLDLEWWNELLPAYNGVQLFDTKTRKTAQLYTDASLHGLGGFYYEHG